MTPLERAIRAGCDGLHPTQREQFPCHFPDCQRGDCDVPQIVGAALAAALADGEALIVAIKAEFHRKRIVIGETDAVTFLAALRRYILSDP